MSQKTTGFGRLRAGSVLLTLLFTVVASPGYGQKTDVLTFRNGDQVTGEIKKLEYGLLGFSTDAMRTVNVQWPKVVSAATDKTFEIVLENGAIYIGSLEPGSGDSVVVRTESESVATPTQKVVRLTRIRRGFWRALDGNINLGFDFTQQNAKTDLNIDAAVTYVAGAGTNRGVSWRSKGATYTKINFTSTFSRQDGIDDITRLNGGLAHARQYGGRWFFLGFFTGTKNSQLSLDSRISVGGGLGRLMVESNRVDLALWLAPAYSREQYAGQPTSTSIPVIVSGDFLFFVWDPLDAEISSQLEILPILNESGRWRINFTLSATKELVKDVDLSIGIKEYFDNQPPIAGTNQNDFSLTTSFGWSF